MDSSVVDVNAITHIRITDVVGNINPNYATYDSYGNAVNDPYPTAFPVGGFDLDAVAVLKEWLINSADNLEETTVQMYPNPVRNTLYVSGAESVAIFNMQGQQILYVKNINNVDLSDFESGFYIVQLKVLDRVVVKRLVKE